MELEIVTKKENPLMDRVELEVMLHHTGEPTPQRDVVREQVAAAMKASKDQVLVDHLDTTFGKGLTRGYVKVYSSKQRAVAIDRKHLVARNKMGAKEPAKETPKEPVKAPEEGKEPED